MNKNYKKYLVVMIFSIVIQAGYGHYKCADAIGVSLDEVVINSNTHGDPSNITTVTIGWAYTNTQDITGFFYTITTSSSHTVSTEGPKNLPLNIIAKSKTFNNVSDGTYYFYIAAANVDTEPFPTVSNTTKVGPITVDTEAPENVSVTGPDETTEQLVTLNIGADEDIYKICISETNYGNCGWIDIESNEHTYSLNNGEGKYKLYVEVEDIAGNTAKASPFEITYASSESLTMANYTSVPTLTQWGMILFFIILLSFGLVLMRKTYPIVSLKQN